MRRGGWSRSGVATAAARYTGRPRPGVEVPRTTTVWRSTETPAGVDMADTLSRSRDTRAWRCAPQAVGGLGPRRPGRSDKVRKIDDALRRCRGPVARRARVDRARAGGPDHDLAARRGHDDGSGPEHPGPDGAGSARVRDARSAALEPRIQQIAQRVAQHVEAEDRE